MDKQFINRSQTCFISDELNAKDYNIIEYSKIYDFYKKYIKDSDKYFEDFVNSLYKHTLSVDSEIYDIMLDRFIDAIQNASK